MTTDGKNDSASRRFSEIPVDLTREREEFVRTFMREGVELTDQLLDELGELRVELAELRADNARLRNQIASDDAIRDLLRKIESLEVEKSDLLNQSSSLAQRQQQASDRYNEVEREVNELANLYIASFQLQALSVRRVVRHLKDILGQLVGAEGFVIYALDRERRQATPLGFEGVDASEVNAIPIGQGHVGDALSTSVSAIKESLEGGSVGDPLAVIPMVVDDTTVGAITVTSVLPHKRVWASVDRELFKLIGARAGVALVAANLYAEHGDTNPLAALLNLRQNLARRSDAPAGRG